MNKRGAAIILVTLVPLFAFLFGSAAMIGASNLRQKQGHTPAPIAEYVYHPGQP